MMKFKEVWFDFDGTIAVSSPEFNKAHDELRYELYAEALKLPVTDEIKTKYEKLSARYGTNSAVFKSLGFSDSYWMDKFEAADLARYYKPREDVSLVLTELAKRSPIGIFTNNKRSTVDATLRRLNIPAKLFVNTLTGDEVPERKPDLTGFKLMLRLANCEPSDFLFIGDRYKADIEPIQKLGGKGALVWGEDQRADYSFLAFTDLLKINK